MSAIMESGIETRKRLRVMYSQSSRAQPQASLRGRRLAVIAWAAAVIAVLMTLVPSAAQACPNRHTSSGITGSVTIAQKIPHLSQATIVSRTGVATRGAHCCGLCGHGGTAGCMSGCCAACSTAIDIVDDGIELPDASASPGLSIQGKIVALAPPPDFRPPRLFA